MKQIPLEEVQDSHHKLLDIFAHFIFNIHAVLSMKLYWSLLRSSGQLQWSSCLPVCKHVDNKILCSSQGFWVFHFLILLQTPWSWMWLMNVVDNTVLSLPLTTRTRRCLTSVVAKLTPWPLCSFKSQTIRCLCQNMTISTTIKVLHLLTRGASWAIQSHYTGGPTFSNNIIAGLYAPDNAAHKHPGYSYQAFLGRCRVLLRTFLLMVINCFQSLLMTPFTPWRTQRPLSCPSGYVCLQTKSSVHLRQCKDIAPLIIASVDYPSRMPRELDIQQKKKAS